MIIESGNNNYSGNLLSKKITVTSSVNGFLEFKSGSDVVHSFNFIKGETVSTVSTNQGFDSIYSDNNCEIAIDEV